MTLLNNFIIPLIKAFFYVLIFGGLSFILVRFFYIKWSRRWKFFVKYKIFRKAFREKDLSWCLKAMEMNMSITDVKKKMLLSSQTNDRTYEMMWIFRQVQREMKGGIDKSGREFKGSDRKAQSTTELPSVSSDK